MSSVSAGPYVSGQTRATPSSRRPIKPAGLCAMPRMVAVAAMRLGFTLHVSLTFLTTGKPLESGSVLTQIRNYRELTHLAQRD